eukprot:m.275978 g.275978  ORF g.275978 m.275978 type:complete len:63 (+) comp15703_c0_seq7:52-240(+)
MRLIIALPLMLLCCAAPTSGTHAVDDMNHLCQSLSKSPIIYSFLHAHTLSHSLGVGHSLLNL